MNKKRVGGLSLLLLGTTFPFFVFSPPMAVAVVAVGLWPAMFWFGRHAAGHRVKDAEYFDSEPVEWFQAPLPEQIIRGALPGEPCPIQKLRAKDGSTVLYHAENGKPLVGKEKEGFLNLVAMVSAAAKGLYNPNEVIDEREVLEAGLREEVRQGEEMRQRIRDRYGPHSNN